VEGRPPEQPASRYVSRGLTRSRTDKLVVMPGGERGTERGGMDRGGASSPSPAGGGSASEASRGGAGAERGAMERGGASSSSPLVGEGRGGGSGSKITSLAAASARAHVEGTAALKPERAPSPAEALENLPWSPSRAEARAEAKALAAEKRAEAKAQGYEGEACGECGNFTLLRNGTCLKCNTCGSTTGCS
jgi:ribonucleoside-diphosphate reductase alpha chain